MKEVFFSGYITGNEVTHHCTQDGKTHFLNLSIAFYNGKDKQGNEKTGYLDISIVINQESRVDSILPILVKGNYIHGRGKSTTKIIHVVNKKTNKTEPVINEQVECRVEAVQIVARKSAEPTDNEGLQHTIDGLHRAMCAGSSLMIYLSDLLCIKHGVESIDVIEQPDEKTAQILADMDKIMQGHGVNG